MPHNFDLRMDAYIRASEQLLHRTKRIVFWWMVTLFVGSVLNLASFIVLHHMYHYLRVHLQQQPH